MNLQEQLLKEHSRNNTIFIANWIGSNKERFGELMHLFFQGEPKVVQRAAWVVSYCFENCQELVPPYLSEMVDYCNTPGIHDAVKRNVTRIIAHLNIPEKLEEPLLNLCFELLINPKETVAVRCWCMDILLTLSRTYPEIKNELQHIIEDALEHQEITAAFKSKSKRVLLALKKRT
ncbi:MAG: hypothetical protein WC716_01910 [Chitinophagaceae bacterium]|jgi:hypothetical protein